MYDVSKYTRTEYCFDYSNITANFTEEEIRDYCVKIHRMYKGIVANWDDNSNYEWVLRTYFGIKLILSSSLMASSLEFSSDRNVRIVEPYLTYYCLLNCSRVVLLTLPQETWRNGELLKSNHSRIINVVSDAVQLISPRQGDKLKRLLETGRDYRELFSYRFPNSGIDVLDDDEKVTIEQCIQTSQLLCEIAQLNSEILDYNLDTYLDKEVNLDKNKLVSFVRNNQFGIYDPEDSYRLGYIARKCKRPTNLWFTMTEGLVEDFYGAWCPNDDDENEHIYNPDRDWRILFPVP